MTDQPTTPGPEGTSGEHRGDPQASSGHQTPDEATGRTAPRPQYGLRSSDLGLPSPYDQYRSQEQASQTPWPAQNQPPQNQPGQGPWQGYGQPGQGPQSPQGWGQPMGNPQPWQTQAGYQQFPPAVPPTPMPAPRRIEWAFWLILSAGLLSLIAALASMLHLDFNAVLDQAMRQAEARQGTTMDQATLKAARTVAVVFIFVMFAAMLVLYALVAVFVRKGHQWARILGTVFAAISVLGLFTTDILSLAGTVAGIVAIVLCWVGDSNAYFADAKLQRDYRRFQRFQSRR